MEPRNTHTSCTSTVAPHPKKLFLAEIKNVSRTRTTPWPLGIQLKGLKRKNENSDDFELRIPIIQEGNPPKTAILSVARVMVKQLKTTRRGSNENWATLELREPRSRQQFILARKRSHPPPSGCTGSCDLLPEYHPPFESKHSLTQSDRHFCSLALIRI